MVKATDPQGKLQDIEDCYLQVESRIINFKVLPELSDSKSASYNDESVIGRSFPIKTYSHSENRSISIKVTFIVTEDEDIQRNLMDYRALQSATYPRDGSPYRPPPICKLKCGEILANDVLCVVIKNYSASFPTNFAWDEDTKLPYYFSVNLQCDVVYPTSDLPGQERIFTSGR